VSENSERKLTLCGTHGAIKRHRRSGEPLCQSCKDFENSKAKENYQKNREVKLVYQSEYNTTHRYQINLWSRQWRKNNVEQERARNRDYYQRNKDKNLIKAARRRAMVRGNGIEPYTLKQVLEEYGAICYLCEIPIDLTAPRSARQEGWEYGLHLDHVTPISKGGQDCLDNVAPTHAICNLSKGDS
jgi:5-methylcytosine-specific restriction endonuclease McrA